MASTQRPGCLLFAIPRALLGGARPAALPDGLALPELDTGAIDPQDLPQLIKTRNVARACHAMLQRADLGEVATQDAGRELIGWVTRIYQMGPALRRARQFVVAHNPDQVARDKAELELELMEASPAQIRDLKAAMKALDARAGHAAQVQEELERLASRLTASTAELEALQAKLGAELGSDGLVHEVRAWRQSAALALDAFTDTVGELE